MTMGLLDNDLDITVEQLDKIEALRLIKMSNLSVKGLLKMENVTYHKPDARIKNKCFYMLEVASDFDMKHFHIGWNLFRDKKFKNHYIYRIDIKCSDVRLSEFESRDYTFDNFEEKFQAVLNQYNITL